MIDEMEHCNCDCHEQFGVEHIIPCCYNCHYCDNNIVTFYYDSHIKDCEEKHKDFSKPLVAGK